MDLALALGRTLDELDEMSTVEFQLWQKYTARRMLPWRRMELYLAQITQHIAVTMGGAKNTRLTDFTFDPIEETEDAAEAFGFNPRKPAREIDPDAPDPTYPDPPIADEDNEEG